jgi:hypothetical protein
MPKGQWTPPDAGEDAPAEVKDILARVYSDFRDENPAEDPAVKAKGAQIAWGAVKRAGWEKDADGKWVKKPAAKESAVFDSDLSHFRLIEVKDKSGLLIDVHIIAPGWGSSGYYSEAVLKKACEAGVYPEGMHMHIDHPTRAAEKEQPARTIKGQSPLAAVLTEAGHYDPKGWDGPGVYAKARVLPQFVEDIKAMDGHIGISHYVSGKSEIGEAEGKKGPIIQELITDALNTVDFVTVPGAGGHYRTLFSEMKVGRQDPIGNMNTQRKTMGDKQESLTLSEVRTNHPEIFEEMKQALSEELKIEAATKDQSKKLAEAADKIKELEQKVAEQAVKLAEVKAREYIAAEIAKAKIPETSGKILTEQLVKLVILTEDGEIDAPKFGQIVTEAVKAKADEIAAIKKETGITGNGGGAPPAGDGKKALIESFEAAYLKMGKTPEDAKKLAEIAAGGR